MEELPVQPIDLYRKKDRMYVAADCIIFGFDSGSLKLLLFKRKVEPLRGQWSLIGSFVHLEESISEAARRVLAETTGLTEVYMEQLRVYGEVDRDPGFRCISVGFYALIRLDGYDRKFPDQYEAEWHEVEDLPPLILDHEQMVNDAMDQLKLRARTRPIGFELLPEKFTIPQLQLLYEAIYREKLDARNFRKKVLSHNVLIRLEEKDRESSKRGAFLYRFDRQHYDRLVASGYRFEV